MPVVGELVEAQVGHHDEVRADRRHQVPDGAVEDAVGIGGPRADRVPVAGHPEEHHAADADLGGDLRRLDQRLPGVVDHPGHRRDRQRHIDALPDEQRQHELGRVEPGLGDQSPQRGSAAQPAGAILGKHSGDLSKQGRKRGPRAGGCARLSVRPALRAAAGSDTSAGGLTRRGRGRSPIPSGRLAPRPTPAPARPPSGLALLQRVPPQRLTVLGQGGCQRRDARSLGQDVDAQAVLLGGLGRLRADAGHHRRGMRLAGDAFAFYDSEMISQLINTMVCNYHHGTKKHISKPTIEGVTASEVNYVMSN